MTSPIVLPGGNGRVPLRFDQMNKDQQIRWLHQEVQATQGALNETRAHLVLMKRAQNDMLHLLAALVRREVRANALTNGTSQEAEETRFLDLAGEELRDAEDAFRLMKHAEWASKPEPERAVERERRSLSIRLIASLAKHEAPGRVEERT